MLSNLNIENIAVIERASIDFQPGLNVLTGETGAGKSIIIDSLNAVLGERTSRELIRSGTDRARVTARFEQISPRARAALEEQGYAEEDGAVLLQREMTASGKNIFRINGVPAPAAAVRVFGQAAVNIHGQHENQQLLSPQQHIHYLDVLGDLQPALAEYQRAYREAVRLKHELESVSTDEQEKARRADLLTYQIRELTEANLRDGERAELIAHRAAIQNAEKIHAAVNGTRAFLSGSEDAPGAVQMMHQTAEQLREAGNYRPELQKQAERLATLSYELEDIEAELRDYAETAEESADELDTIEERLDQLYRLGIKYGAEEADMLRFLAQAQAELDSIEHEDEKKAELESAYPAAVKRARDLALALSEQRQRTASRFIQQVTEELAFLDMPRVKLSMAHEFGNLNSSGCDRFEIRIAANPGEEPKPMTKIASGGELSRIMLAIKNVLADKDEIDTLIFDEIDTGISGRAALKVGCKLRQVAENRQVLCVTHLAQIAASANTHLLIEKQVRNDRTYTDVRPLDHAGRCTELARIMSGTDSPTPLQLQSAEELLQTAEK